MALHTRVLRLVLSGLMGALLVVSKQAMSGLPNLEPVSLLIILFALELPRETPGAITVFILLQGVLYGFGLWWVIYSLLMKSTTGDYSPAFITRKVFFYGSRRCASPMLP